MHLVVFNNVFNKAKSKISRYANDEKLNQYTYNEWSVSWDIRDFGQNVFEKSAPNDIAS